MALTSGTKLGPYEIQSPLGAGGMGEVYRANDTRLDRTVAIKILPQHLSSNPDLGQRFAREARAISSLNHPRICTLYDVGHQDGIDFLVMEYLEGETLAQRLKKGRLPLKEALKIGIDVCEALEKAHLAGIIHRDLKPGKGAMYWIVPTTVPAVVSGESGLERSRRDPRKRSGAYLQDSAAYAARLRASCQHVSGQEPGRSFPDRARRKASAQMDRGTPGAGGALGGN